MQRSIIAPAERVTNLRWGIALLLGFGIFVSTFDRVTILAIASDVTSLGADDGAFGFRLSAIAIVYAIAQLPLGVLVDAYGATRAGRVAAALWGIIALATAALTGPGAIWAMRLGILAESPAYPLAAAATAAWFPRTERGFATAIFSGSGKLALAVGVPAVMWVAFVHGWQATFTISGILGALLLVAFAIFYRDPAVDGRLTFAERKHLTDGDARMTTSALTNGVTMLSYLARRRKVWGLALGFASFAYAFYFFAIADVQLAVHAGASNAQIAWLWAIPWLIAGAVDLLVCGLLVDALIRRGADATRVRTGIIVAGMICGAFISGAHFTQSPIVATVCATIALCGLSCASTTSWAIPGLIAPRGAVATVASFMTGTAIVIGALAIPIANIVSAPIAAGVVLIAGILSYVFLLGRIEPIPDPM